MSFIYYIVRKSDQQIIQGADDMVAAIDIANKLGCAYFIMQGCVLTEGGQDPQPVVDNTDSVEDETE